jgi:hypothetical protein
LALAPSPLSSTAAIATRATRLNAIFWTPVQLAAFTAL